MLIGLALLQGCQPPPSAPEDLDPLLAFLFEHHLDDDPEALALGLVGLRDWFAEGFDPEENASFELLTPLSAAGVGTLDPSTAWTHPDTKAERLVTGMGGAAAGTVGPHSLDAYVHALTAVDQDVVFPEMFAEWSRTWRLCDGERFAVRECERTEADEQQHSVFALGLESEGEAYNQYRWVDLPDGTRALSHRNWQIYPPATNSDLLEVEDQYYLNILVEAADQGSVARFQATWAVFGDDVPRDLALNLTAGSMFDSSQEMEAWLAEQARR